MPIVTEIMAPRYVELFSEKADIIQIGARNMQNFDLLKEVGQTKKPILLKRGLSSTIEELLMSAGILCRAETRTSSYVNAVFAPLRPIHAILLISARSPQSKKLSHLPVVVDPSHASGLSYMVESLALAAVAAGADGLLIEVHNDPKHALCDGAQSLTPEAFEGVMHKINALKNVMS